jgi:hypothetical protein
VLAGLLLPRFDRFLVFIFNREEVKNVTTIESPPKLNDEQINYLKETLKWWNFQCDGWYRTEPIAVDNLLASQAVNLIDLRRISQSISYGLSLKKIPEKHSQTLKKLKVCCHEGIEKICKEIQDKKAFNEIIDQTDILNKQVSASKMSAVAALASAIATVMLVIFTFMSRPD